MTDPRAEAVHGGPRDVSDDETRRAEGTRPVSLIVVLPVGSLADALDHLDSVSLCTCWVAPRHCPRPRPSDHDGMVGCRLFPGERCRVCAERER